MVYIDFERTSVLWNMYNVPWFVSEQDLHFLMHCLNVWWVSSHFINVPRYHRHWKRKNKTLKFLLNLRVENIFFMGCVKLLIPFLRARKFIGNSKTSIIWGRIRGLTYWNRSFQADAQAAQIALDPHTQPLTSYHYFLFGQTPHNQGSQQTGYFVSDNTVQAALSLLEENS